MLSNCLTKGCEGIHILLQWMKALLCQEWLLWTVWRKYLWYPISNLLGFILDFIHAWNGYSL